MRLTIILALIGCFLLGCADKVTNNYYTDNYYTTEDEEEPDPYAPIVQIISPQNGDTVTSAFKLIISFPEELPVYQIQSLWANNAVSKTKLYNPLNLGCDTIGINFLVNPDYYFYARIVLTGMSDTLNSSMIRLFRLPN